MSKYKGKKKQKIALAVSLGLALGIGGMLPASTVLAGTPKETKLWTEMRSYWQGHGNWGFNDTLILHRPFYNQDYTTHWLASNQDSAYGYMDVNRLNDIIKDSSFTNIVKFVYDGFSEINVSRFHRNNHNGAYKGFMSFTDVSYDFYLTKDRYGNVSYCISPLTYINPGSTSHIEDGSIMTVMMPISIRDLIVKAGVSKELVDRIINVVRKVGGVVTKVVEAPGWAQNADIEVNNGGTLVLMLLPARPNNSKITVNNGNIANFVNLAGLTIDTDVDSFSGSESTIFNTGSILSLENAGSRIYDFNADIGDINLLSSGINLGITRIGSDDKPNTVIDMGNHGLEQGLLAIHGDSTLITHAPGKLNVTLGIINNGTLILDDRQGTTGENTANSTKIYYVGSSGKATLSVQYNMENTASITQKKISITPNVVMTNTKNFFLTPGMETLVLDNQGTLVGKDGYNMKVDPGNANTQDAGKVINLGNIVLDNGGGLEVGTENIKVAGTITAIGKNSNKMELTNTSRHIGVINIGTASGDTGNLSLSDMTLDGSGQLNLYANSNLILGDGAKGIFDGDNDLLEGNIKVSSGGEATFGQATVGLDAGFKGAGGKVNVGGNQFAQGGTLALNNNGSYIDGTALNLEANGTLSVNAQGAKVLLDNDDTWKGNISLEQGTLKIDNGSSVGQEGTLEATGGKVQVAAGTLTNGGGSVLNIANKSYIEAGTQVTTGKGGSVFSGGGINVAGGEVTINGAGSSGKLAADDIEGYTKVTDGTLLIKDKADYFTDNGTRFTQSGGEVIVDNASVELKATDFTISEYDNTLKGGSTQLRNQGSLTVENKKSNKTEITADDSANTVKVANNSTLAMAGNSKLTTATKVQVDKGSTIETADKSTLALGNNADFKGTVALNGEQSRVILEETLSNRGADSKLVVNKGTLEVKADNTLSEKDEFHGGKVSIAKDKTLTNNNTAAVASALHNEGNLAGSGKWEVLGNSDNTSSATINQSELVVKKGGTLTNANKTAGSVKADVVQIEAGGRLSTNLDAIETSDGKIYNSGTLTVGGAGGDGGTTNYDIEPYSGSMSGSIEVYGTDATFNGAIKQKDFEVAKGASATLNAGTSLTGELANHGTLTNNGDLTLVGKLNNTAGTINGSGKLTINNPGNTSFNNGTINQNTINLSTVGSTSTAKNILINLQGSKITVADSLNIDDHSVLQLNANDFQGKIANGGSLEIEGGALNFNVESLVDGGTTYTGTVTLKKDSSMGGDYTLDNKVVINSGANFTVEDATSLKKAVANAGKLTLTAGILGTDANKFTVSGEGRTVVSGKVDNKAIIDQGVTVSPGTGILTSAIEDLKKAIANDGMLILHGDEIKAANTITGKGTLSIQEDRAVVGNDGIVKNSASITQDMVTIAGDNTFINNASGIITVNNGLIFDGKLTNNGTVNAVINNHSTIDGTGTLNLKGASNNLAAGTVTQSKINVLAGSTLDNAGTMSGTFNLQGDVTGSGTLNIKGDSQVAAKVSNTLVNVDGKTVNIAKSTTVDSIINANNSLVNFGSGGTVNVGSINGNDGTTTASAPSMGRIDVNNTTTVNVLGDLAGQNIDLGAGTLALGANADLGGKSSIALHNGGKLDLSSLSKDNNSVNFYNFDVQSSDKRSGLLIDVNMADGTSDQLVISGKAESTTGGTLHLAGVNITQDIENIGVEKRISLVKTDGAGGSIANSFKIADTTVATNTGSYALKQDGAGSGDLLAQKINAGVTLAQAIADEKYDSYSFTNQEGSLGALGKLAGGARTFTIFGNGNVLDGDGQTGLQTWKSFHTSGQFLTIKDVTFQNFKATSTPDTTGEGYAISHLSSTDVNSKLILDGITMKENYDRDGKAVDILSYGDIEFSGKESYLEGGIEGISAYPDHGTVAIKGTTLTLGDNAYINQASLTIDANGKLVAGADKLTLHASGNKVENDGVLELKGLDADLSSNVTGSGTTNIVGTVTNIGGKNLDNKVNVAAGGSLNTNVQNLLKSINNEGSLILQGTSSMNNVITGSGALEVAGNMTNNANITQGSIVIDNGVTLTNNADKIVAATNEGLFNYYNLANAGTVQGAINNEGNINGTGTLLASGASKNGSSAVISQKDFVIANGTLTNDNDSQDVLTATNGITIQNTGKLSTHANAVGSQLKNDGIYEVLNGDGQGIAYDVTGSGATVINTREPGFTVNNNAVLTQAVVAVQQGTLNNKGLITAQVQVAQPSTLKSDITLIKGVTLNDGTYEATGADGTEFNYAISGTGTLMVNGKLVNKTYLDQGNTVITQQLTNEGVVAGHATVNAGAVLDSGANNMLSTITNNGVYNVKGGQVTAAIDGSGTMNLEDNVAVEARVSQTAINVQDNVMLRANADNIDAVVNNGIDNLLDPNANGGIYVVTGGTISKNVNGADKGLMLVQGAVKNRAEVKQDYLGVEGSLSNTGNIAVNELYNKGSVTNEAVLKAKTVDNNVAAVMVNEGTAQMDYLDNAGNINGTGALEIAQGAVNRAGATLAQKSVSLKGAVLDNDGLVTADSVNVDKDSYLFSNASAMQSVVVNNGVYSITNGTISHDIYDNDSTDTQGIVLINGAVTNQAGISQDNLDVDADSSLNNQGTITLKKLLDNSGTTVNTGLIEAPVYNEGVLHNEGTVKGVLGNYHILDGSGKLELTGNNVNGAGATITQDTISLTAGSFDNANVTRDALTFKSMTLDEHAQLVSHADAINGRVTVNGLYYVQGGNIHGDINGDGTVQIAQDASNSASISSNLLDVDPDVSFTNNAGAKLNGNFIVVEGADTEKLTSQDAVFNAYAGDVDALVFNDGIYNMNAGTFKRNILGEGVLNVVGNALSAGDNLVEQHSLNISGGASLGNEGRVLIDSFTHNEGTIANQGVLSTYLDNKGTISGNSGTLLLKGNEVTPVSESALNAALESGDLTGLKPLLDTANQVVNTNTGNITQKNIALQDYGILDNAHGKITAELMTVGTGAEVTSNASNISAAINNDGNYYVQGGTIAQNVVGSGNTYLQQNTVNNALLDQTYTRVENGVQLVNNGVVQSSEATDDVQFANMAMDSFNLLGSNKITEFLEAAYGSGVAKGTTFSNLGEVINNGVLNGAVSNNGTISGTGNLELQGSSTNAEGSTISQNMISVMPLGDFVNSNESFKALSANKVVVDDAGKFTSNAFAVGAPVENDGNYIISGSKELPNVINYNILGSGEGNGIVQISPETGTLVVNDATIDQSLIIVGNSHLYNNEHKQLTLERLSINDSGTVTTSASDLNLTNGGSVDNEGVLNLRGAQPGVINYDIIGESADTSGALDAAGMVMTMVSGTVNILSDTTIASREGGAVQISQAKVNVAKGATLTNNGNIYATALTNKGKVVNALTVETELKNYGTISGEGTLTTHGTSETYGDISNSVVIAEGSLNAYDRAALAGAITNDHTLNLAGTGTGVKVSGNITNSGLLGGSVGTINVGIAVGGSALDKATLTGTVSGQNINVNSGTLSIQTGPAYNNVKLNFAGSGTLSTLDKTKSELQLDSLTAAGGVTGTLSFDLGDTVKVGSADGGSGTLKLGNVLIDVSQPVENKNLFFSGEAQTLTGEAITFGDGVKYSIAQDMTDKHYLGITQELTDKGLNPAIDELNTHDEVTFVVSGNLEQQEALHDIPGGGKHILLAGNGHDAAEDNIAATGTAGTTVAAGSGLTVQNINNISGFSSAEGGFANNKGQLQLNTDEGTTNLSGNQAAGNGGALANNGAGPALGSSGANLQAGTASFSNNMAGAAGGAVANIANGNNATADLTKNEFKQNTAGTEGGAVANLAIGTSDAAINLQQAQFTDNQASGNGGALSNNVTGSGSALADVNGASFTGNQAAGNGGAIANLGGASIGDSSSFNPATDSGKVSIEKGNFAHNTAGGSGGAIYNGNAQAVVLTDTSFTNNTAGAQGGAVYTAGHEVTINAENSNVDISGNTAGGKSNALYLANDSGSNPVSLELNAGEGRTLNMGDGVIAANTGNLVLNLNTNNENRGIVHLGSSFAVRDEAGNYLQTDYNLPNGTLQLGDESNFSGQGNNNLILGTMTNLDTANAKLGTLQLGSLTTTGHTPYINWGLDLGDNASDQIIPADDSSVAAGTILNINKVNVGLVSDTLRDSYAPLHQINNLTYNLDPELDGKQYAGKIYDRVLTLQGDAFGQKTLAFEFSRFNPSIMASSILAQAALSTQQNSYDQAFGNIDSMMEQRNTHGQEADVWAKLYRTSEQMNLGNLNPRNAGGGTFVGVDSPVKQLKNDWTGVYTAYLGYNHMTQNVEDVNGLENSGTLGLAATFMKENFFVSTTANVGLGRNEIDTRFGKDHVNSTSYGIANKVGINLPTDRPDWKLQLNNTLAYSHVDLNDFTNAAGIKVANGGINSFQIAPEVKLTIEQPTGWNTYAGVKQVWNLGGRTRFAAEGIALDEYTPGNYMEYSLGASRSFAKTFATDAMFAYRAGSRDGYALRLNMRWFF